MAATVTRERFHTRMVAAQRADLHTLLEATKFWAFWGIVAVAEAALLIGLARVIL